jgi:hypothetical protein
MARKRQSEIHVCECGSGGWPGPHYFFAASGFGLQLSAVSSRVAGSGAPGNVSNPRFCERRPISYCLFAYCSPTLHAAFAFFADIVCELRAYIGSLAAPSDPVCGTLQEEMPLMQTQSPFRKKAAKNELGEGFPKEILAIHKAYARSIAIALAHNSPSSANTKLAIE